MYFCSSINTIDGYKHEFYINESEQTVLVMCDGQVMAEYSSEHIDNSLLVRWLMIISCGGGEYLPQDVREAVDDALTWYYESES